MPLRTDARKYDSHWAQGGFHELGRRFNGTYTAYMHMNVVFMDSLQFLKYVL